jgi:hypothetical protein
MLISDVRKCSFQLEFFFARQMSVPTPDLRKRHTIGDGQKLSHRSHLTVRSPVEETCRMVAKVNLSNTSTAAMQSLARNDWLLQQFDP